MTTDSYDDYSDYDSTGGSYDSSAGSSSSGSTDSTAPKSKKKKEVKARKVTSGVGAQVSTKEVRKATAPAKEHMFHNHSYSTGKRKALLIGINYIGQGKAELSGCANDVVMAKERLDKLHFNDYLVLLEGTANPPTKANIRQGFKWLTRGAKPGDVLFCHFSGHGTQVPDKDGDETDGLDEAICPVDFKSKGVITDDEIRRDMVDPLPSGCTIYNVFDCCHSGTVIDFRHIYDEKSRTFIDDMKRKETDAEAFVITGCKSSQKSADLPPGAVEDSNGAQGALSSALYPNIHKRMSWADLVAVLRYRMSYSKLQQVPQLEAGRAHDTSDVAFRRILKERNQKKTAKKPPAQPPVKEGSGKPPGTCAVATYACIGLCVTFSVAAIAAAENNGIKSSKLEMLLGMFVDDGGPKLNLIQDISKEDEEANADSGSFTADDLVV